MKDIKVKQQKRKAGLLIACLVLLTQFAFSQVTTIDSGTCGATLTWKLTTDSTLTISGSGAMDHYFYLPPYDGPPPWYSYRNTIKTVLIGNSITTIGCHVFSYCKNLNSVTIGNSITIIGNMAFFPCDSLASITIYAIIPPALGYGTFDFNPTNIPVYVPCSAYDSYRNAPGWSNFTNFIPIEQPDTTYYSYYFCYGSTYSDSNFTNLKQDGLHYKTLQNSNGCDSIICLNLGYYTSTPATYYSDTICQGKSYSDNNFTNLTKAGFHYNYLKNRFGCDSTIILELIVHPVPPITQLFDSIRSGDTCNFNGRLLTQDGIYYDTLQAINGCDSIIELTLTISNLGIVTITNYELRIYPNPTDGKITIHNSQFTVHDIEIFDIYGKKLLSLQSLLSPETEIDISHLSNGVYFLKLNNKIMYKIIKTHKSW